jgi:hypothetical protein
MMLVCILKSRAPLTSRDNRRTLYLKDKHTCCDCKGYTSIGYLTSDTTLTLESCYTRCCGHDKYSNVEVCIDKVGSMVKGEQNFHALSCPSPDQVRVTA